MHKAIREFTNFNTEIHGSFDFDTLHWSLTCISPQRCPLRYSAVIKHWSGHSKKVSN